MAARALALSLILLAPAAHAQEMLSTTPQAVLSVAQGFGSAQMDAPDHNGRPIISGMVDGTRYGILFYGCENGADCDSIQFFASFTSPNNALDFLNEWNADQRFGSAYREDDGDVILHYSANLDFGVSRRNMEDTFDIWQLTLTDFADRMFSDQK